MKEVVVWFLGVVVVIVGVLTFVFLVLCMMFGDFVDNILGDEVLESVKCEFR